MKMIKQIFAKSILGIAVLSLFLFTASCSQEGDANLIEDLTVVEAKGGKDVTRPVRITLEGMDNADGPGAQMWGKMTHLGKIYGPVAEGEIYEEVEGGFKFRTIEGNPYC